MQHAYMQETLVQHTCSMHVCKQHMSCTQVAYMLRIYEVWQELAHVQLARVQVELRKC